jgi:hypothetical protein
MATSQSTIDTISNWYKDSLGRDADQSGLDYWSNVASSGRDLDSLKSDFLWSAKDNGENVNQSSDPYSSGLINSSPQATPNFSSVDYNGEKVLTGKNTLDEIDSSRQSWNAMTGSNYTLQEYDKFLNPTTYGARWGIPASTTKKQATALAPTTGADATLLNPEALAKRTVDPRTETVSGQLDSMLAKDSPYLQQARARGERVLAGRGLINSTMAGSAGEDAAISAALNIATPDASIYGRASDYNAALTNQAGMYNADTLNSFAGKRIDQENQMSLAQLQSNTAKYTAELNANTSRYNVDQDYKRTMDANRDSLINNILMQSADNMSPDRKAALLEQLGMGTAAKRDASGGAIPGTGLAGAVYVIDSVASDLRPTTSLLNGNAGGGSGMGGEGGDGGTGGVNGSAGTGDGGAAA